MGLYLFKCWQHEKTTTIIQNKQWRHEATECLCPLLCMNKVVIVCSALYDADVISLGTGMHSDMFILINKSTEYVQTTVAFLPITAGFSSWKSDLSVFNNLTAETFFYVCTTYTFSRILQCNNHTLIVFFYFVVHSKWPCYGFLLFFFCCSTDTCST